MYINLKQLIVCVHRPIKMTVVSKDRRPSIKMGHSTVAYPYLLLMTNNKKKILHLKMLRCRRKRCKHRRTCSTA